MSGDPPSNQGRSERPSHCTGGVPPEWGRLEELAELRAGHNKLDGSLPATLGALPLLRALHAPHNALRGTMPEWLVTAPSLREVDLSDNALHGRLPAGLWDAQRGSLVPLPPRRS